MSFLKAEWRKLVMINYEVDPKVLSDYIPEGTELDFFNGKCYLSLIGFMFLNTKLMGMRIPFHINFEEVNLRFYVKRKLVDKERRGVVFIKEIVPKSAITFIANTIYKENYQTLPMTHHLDERNEKINVSYSWKTKTQWNSISVEAIHKQKAIEKNSIIEFISEHYWGYSKGKKTTEYEVKHPKWKYYPIENLKIDVDFSESYGSEFNFLKDIVPSSVMLLEGSKISVENKTII